MSVLRSYNNTIQELKLIQKRLEVLEAKKEELFYRICYPQGWHTDDGSGSKSTSIPSSVTEKFASLCNEVNERTGLSLNDEINVCKHEIERLKKLVDEMNTILKNLDGIEYEIYAKIVVDGLKPTRAVQHVAQDHFMSEDNVWRTYYSKVKQYLVKLQ